MTRNLKISLAAALTMALCPAVYAQDNSQHKPQGKTPSESGAPSDSQTDSQNGGGLDALDKIFEGTEDELNQGNHCGPEPEPKEKPAV